MEFKDLDIILASGSPRRRELLTGMAIPFRVADAYAVEERYPTSLPLAEVPGYLSRLKSEAYPIPLAENQILITADTLVLLGERALGKPKDRQAAIEMLNTLSGGTHHVTTGVTIRNHAAQVTFSETTAVTFGTLSMDEIAFYVDTFRPYNKAGAYGIQEWIGYVGIERIDGSFYNVMGLPTRLLYTKLTDFIRTRYSANHKSMNEI